MPGRCRVGVYRVPLPPEDLTPHDLALDLLQADPAVEPVLLDRVHSPLAPEDISGFDALVAGPSARATFACGAPRLLALANRGVGMDGWDLDACTEHGVVVFNTQGSNKHGVAAAVLGYMLLLSKNLVGKDRAARLGMWPHAGRVPGARQLFGHEIQGRALGLIGFGDTAREVVRLVAPLEMEVLAHTPRLTPERARAGGAEAVPWDVLLRRSDFVSLHCPVTEESRGMIGRRALGLMKPSAYLINVCRGALVDQEALAEALRERRIAGAALDAFEPEPLPAGHPLFAVDNAILAPHCAGGSEETHRNMSVVAMRGILRLAHGELPEGIRNPQVLDGPDFRRKLASFQTPPGPADPRGAGRGSR
ncbi:MAG: NAD(P)-dependent oxidoreductase [Candidatus Latescibacterota bacterium]